MDDLIAGVIVQFFAEYINKIIVGLFLVNAFIFVVIMAKSRGIKKIMDETRGPESDRLDPDYPGQTYLQKLRKNYDEWGRRYRNINPWVHYYQVLTTIFPLLGILGTVCGLLQVKTDFSQVEGAFLLALSSTFYGLVAAIISKAGEGVFSPDVDRFRVVYEMFTKDIISIEKHNQASSEAQLHKEVEDAFQH
jgi:hypothetical protein